MKRKPIAVVIVSNGPGELSTWVLPVILHLKKIFDKSPKATQLELSLNLVLVPCPNAAGNEHEVAKKWGLFTTITKANNFWRLLIKPSSFASWPKQGVVVFLGGDQFWSVLLSKRLRYKSITYAEWQSRWPQWNNVIAAMNHNVKKNLSRQNKQKCIVIGDLIADSSKTKNIHKSLQDQDWIAIMPGSKKAKLSIGIPYFLEVVDLVSQIKKDIHVMLPLAPTARLEDFSYFLSNKNPVAKYYSAKIKRITPVKDSYFDYLIETKENSKIFVFTKQPNYSLLSACKLAITTVGANTAELAAINLPMLVVLPTQHLNAMNAWDGIFGILGKIPVVNRLFTFVIKKWYLNNKKYFAWPNIKAGKLIVPERVGNFMTKNIAKEIIYLLNNENHLEEQKLNLRKQRGSKGAVQKLSKIIINCL